MGLGEVKVIHKRRCTGDEAGEPVTGEEVVDVRKVKRTRTGSGPVWRRVFARRASALSTRIATSTERTRVSFPHWGTVE